MAGRTSKLEEPSSAADMASFDDVFISYSSRDKQWVRGELLTRIEQTGLRAFIDYRDFTRGAPSINEMERGVTRCRKTLLILSPDYIASEWCEIENIMSATLSPANRDLRMIPLLKAECDKPPRIAALTHIDFTEGADNELAWRQLLTSLGAPPPEEVVTPRRDQWLLAHPYATPPNFTGRADERTMLVDWMTADTTHPLLVLRGLGGFGKSALTWHWLLHDVNPADWPRVVWWSFYEQESHFESFLAKTLDYLSDGRIDTAKISPREQVDELLRLLRQDGTLLVLDGFERLLRAFSGIDSAYQGDDVARSETAQDHDCDCISPLAEILLRGVASLPGLQGRVLLTTRLRPAALETRDHQLLAGCREEELRQMQPADAVRFFEALGIRGTRAEIEAACEPYGYHPLSLRLLAGWIIGDLQRPGDIAAARRLDVSGDLVQRQHHVLEQSHDSLRREQQQLLGQIACFRGPVPYESLREIAEEKDRAETQRRSEESSEKSSPSWLKRIMSGFGLGSKHTASDGSASALRLDEFALDFESNVRRLIARGLLQRDVKTNRFDLHPIVRRYAYDRLAAGDKREAHARLRDYFAAVPMPEQVRTLNDLAPVIELYHHTVRAGQYDEAAVLFRDRLNKPTYYQLGAYQLISDLLRVLFLDGEDCPPRLKDEAAQAWTLNSLANSYSLSGQPRRAVPLFEQIIVVFEKQAHKKNLAIGLGNLSDDQAKIGELRAAEDNLRRRIALCREIENEQKDAIGPQELGRLLAYRGRWDESAAELATALEVLEKQEHVQGLGIAWAYRALAALLRQRNAHHSPKRQHGESTANDAPSLSLRVSVEEVKRRGPEGAEEEEKEDHRASAFPEPLTSARRALELADEDARTDCPVVRDYVRAHWLLGAAYQAAGEWNKSEQHLHEALGRCRRTNAVDGEADILIDLARLRIATGNTAEARRLADEALTIANRCGYVLQGSDAHLVLADLAQVAGDRDALLHHAAEAKRLATCDGPPDWTYKAAYDEAAALLESAGE